MFCTLHLSECDIFQRFLSTSAPVGLWHSLRGQFPTSEFPGQELTVLQMLSFVRSCSPDHLYQNALASVGIQVFGEHISRSLGG